MKSHSKVWRFFSYDSVTRFATCKFCQKRYKRNATRMMEHLRGCRIFLESDKSHELILSLEKSKTKEDGSIKKIGGDSVEISLVPANEETSIKEDTFHSDTENIETYTDDGIEYETNTFNSQVISVEHDYNSRSLMSDIIPTNPLIPTSGKRKHMEESISNEVSYGSFSNPVRDEFVIFGENVSMELQKLKNNPVLLANTKYEINKILHKSILESLKNDEFLQY